MIMRKINTELIQESKNQTRYNQLREENRLLNLSELDDQKTSLKSLPRAVFVELTQNCNLNCPYCKNRKIIKYNKKFDMETGIFEEIANQLFPTAELVDLRGWGESTILKNFTRYVDIAYDYGVQIRLVTNAMNTNPEIWDRLMAYQSMIAVSCDSADPDKFSAIRGGGNLNRLIETVKAIVKFRDLYRVPKDRVYFTSVISKNNIDDLPELLQFAHSLSLNKVILFPIVVPRSHQLHLSKCLKRAREGLIEAYKTAELLDMELQLGAAPDQSLCLSKDLKKRCMNPWVYTLIDYKGRVGYCDHLIGIRKSMLGNLNKKKFITIWNNKKFQKLRKSHIQKRLPFCFRWCRACYSTRYVDIEHYLDNRYVDKIVSNKTRSSFFDDSTQAGR